MNDSKIIFDNASGYDRMMGVWSQLVGDVFLDWLEFNHGGRWLDIGCGTGAFTQQIIERCSPSEIIGIDPSDDQLQFARSRDGLGSVVFQRGDAMEIPLKNKQFDAATMALVLFFVPDPAKGLSEMIRVTKKNGIVAAYVWDMLGGGFPAEPIQAGLRHMNSNYALPPSVNISKMDNLRQLWEENGLLSIQTKTIKVERTFKSFDEFWEITSNSASIKTVLSDMEEEKLIELKQFVKSHFPEPSDGSIRYSSWANAIQGTVS